MDRGRFWQKEAQFARIGGPPAADACYPQIAGGLR